MMRRSVLIGLGVTHAVLLGDVGLSQPVMAGCMVDTIVIEVDACPEVGGTLTASIVLTNASQPIAGGQFFLGYSTSVFEFDSFSPGDPPFDVGPLWTDVDPVLGRLLYAFDGGSPGTDQDTVLFRVTFQVIGEWGEPYIGFPNEHGRVDRLLLPNEPIPLVANTVDAGDVESIDLADFAALQNCFTGEGVAADPLCQCLFDWEPADPGPDLDVDLADYRAFQKAITGPLRLGCWDGR